MRSPLRRRTWATLASGTALAIAIAGVPASVVSATEALPTLASASAAAPAAVQPAGAPVPASTDLPLVQGEELVDQIPEAVPVEAEVEVIEATVIDPEEINDLLASQPAATDAPSPDAVTEEPPAEDPAPATEPSAAPTEAPAVDGDVSAPSAESAPGGSEAPAVEADGAVSPDAVVSPSATANAADPAAEPTDTSPTPEGADPAPAPEPAPSPTPEAPAPAPSPTAAPIPAAPAETTAPLELDGTEYTPGELIDLTNRVVELPDAPYAFAEGATVAEVSVVGITWTNEGRDDDVTVYMRASTDQGWDEWTVYESAESAPEDPIGGTDPIVVLDAGIEIQVAATYGDAPPEGLELSIVDPGESEADAEATVDSTGAAGQFSPMSVGTRGSPVIYTRSDWGADPQYMKWAPKNVTVAGVVVHHTAGSNGYTASAVPGIIRGIYYYHSVTRGWGDIGYNIVVDTYGRLWEGRAGGLTNPIEGGHARPWNDTAFGISVLGDFTKIRLPEAAMNAMAHAIAWKFELHGVNPRGTMVDDGVRKATIVGHRDVASTTCPGSYIYSRLGELTNRVETIMNSGIYDAPAPAPVTGLEGYNPNYLIADSVMDDSGSMTMGQIQTFLNTQGASCVRGADGSACLKNAAFNTPTRPATAYCSAIPGGNARSAAQVISESATACGINPQVLLVILQKEQGLVTTTNPTAKAYNEATGFRCTDSAPCDPRYAGFVNQVHSAASRLVEYRVNPSAFPYTAGRTYQISYSPTSSCGTTPVTMMTPATAALYNYTPYAANAASLAAVTGTGDSCSAYGNRNFYRNFTLWFGAPNPGAGSAPGAAVLDVDRNLFSSGPSLVTGEGTASALWSPTVTHAWTPSVQIGNGWSSMLAPGDWNGDGVPDAILADAAGKLWLYPRTASGRFLPRVQIGNGWQVMDTILAGVDWDGDGRNDLIGRRSSDGALILYRGSGTGRFLNSSQIGHGWGSIDNLTVVANAFHGRPVIRGVDTNGHLRTYPANGRGGFSPVIVHGHGWNGYLRLVGVGDWTGDGVGDMLAINSSGQMARWEGRADGGITSRTSIGTGWANWPHMSVADQDSSNSPMWAVFQDGRFFQYGYSGSRATQSLGLPSGARPFAAGDWNGDRIPDVMYRAANGDLMLLAGLPRGGFAAATKVGNGWNVFDDVIAVGSWRADGRPALIGYTASTGATRVYFGNGSGGFAGSELLGNWPGASSIFALNPEATAVHPSVGFLSGSSTATYLTRNSQGAVTGRQTMAGTWSGTRAVVGGFDTDGANNREILRVRADGSVEHLIYTSLFTAPRITVLAPAGALGGAAN